MARTRRGPIGFWLGLAVVVIWPLVPALFKRRWRNRERIPPTGGVIVATNHVSYADPLVFARFIWDSGRVPRFLIKDSLFRVPVLGRVLRGADQIPVSRGSADAERLDPAAVEALERGECVCIYPEGTVTRDPDFWPMVGRTGVARLALARTRRWCRSRSGARSSRWTSTTSATGRSRARRPTASPAEPLDLSAYRGRPLTAELLREVTDLIMGAVRAELAEVRGEPAPTAFYRRPPAAREAS